MNKLVQDKGSGCRNCPHNKTWHTGENFSITPNDTKCSANKCKCKKLIPKGATMTTNKSKDSIKVEKIRELFSNLTPSQRCWNYLKYKLQIKEDLGVELSELPFTSLAETENALSMQRSDNTYSLLEIKELTL